VLENIKRIANRNNRSKHIKEVPQPNRNETMGQIERIFKLFSIHVKIIINLIKNRFFKIETRSYIFTEIAQTYPNKIILAPI